MFIFFLTISLSARFQAKSPIAVNPKVINKLDDPITELLIESLIIREENPTIIYEAALSDINLLTTCGGLLDDSFLIMSSWLIDSRLAIRGFVEFFWFLFSNLISTRVSILLNKSTMRMKVAAIDTKEAKIKLPADEIIRRTIRSVSNETTSVSRKYLVACFLNSLLPISPLVIPDTGLTFRTMVYNHLSPSWFLGLFSQT